jgi:hypothetical protein
MREIAVYVNAKRIWSVKFVSIGRVGTGRVHSVEE